MKNFPTRSGWGIAILAGCIALIAAAAMALLALVRSRKQAVPASASTEARLRENPDANRPSRSVTLLPAYPPQLETRNRAMLAARTDARSLRRPGVAARWKSQDRVGVSI